MPEHRRSRTMTATWSALAAVTAAAALMITALPAFAADRNSDGIPDRWERRHHLSLEVNQARRDQDRDGLNNRSEYRHHTNPRQRDTDRDGLNDLQELRRDDDPNDRDSDDDGTPDGDEIRGTVESWDPEGGTLVIVTAAHGDVSGVVTDATRISCEDDDDAVPRASRGDHTPDDSYAVCSTADLTPGALVHEAELDRGAWTKIELEGPGGR